MPSKVTNTDVLIQFASRFAIMVLENKCLFNEVSLLSLGLFVLKSTNVRTSQERCGENLKYRTFLFLHREPQNKIINGTAVL